MHGFLLLFERVEAEFHYGALANLELIFSCLRRLLSWVYSCALFYLTSTAFHSLEPK